MTKVQFKPGTFDFKILNLLNLLMKFPKGINTKTSNCTAHVG